jgi:hypothetical protein
MISLDLKGSGQSYNEENLKGLISSYLDQRLSLPARNLRSPSAASVLEKAQDEEQASTYVYGHVTSVTKVVIESIPIPTIIQVVHVPVEVTTVIQKPSTHIVTRQEVVGTNPGTTLSVRLTNMLISTQIITHRLPASDITVIAKPNSLGVLQFSTMTPFASTRQTLSSTSSLFLSSVVIASSSEQNVSD